MDKDADVINNILIRGSIHACGANTKSIEDVAIQNVSYQGASMYEFIIIPGIHFKLKYNIDDMLEGNHFY